MIGKKRETFPAPGRSPGVSPRKMSGPDKPAARKKKGRGGLVKSGKKDPLRRRTDTEKCAEGGERFRQGVDESNPGGTGSLSGAGQIHKSEGERGKGKSGVEPVERKRKPNIKDRATSGNGVKGSLQNLVSRLMKGMRDHGDIGQAWGDTKLRGRKDLQSSKITRKAGLLEDSPVELLPARGRSKGAKNSGGS